MMVNCIEINCMPVFFGFTLYISAECPLLSCPPLPITRLSIFIFALWLVKAVLGAAAAVHQEHFTASHNPTYRVTHNTASINHFYSLLKHYLKQSYFLTKSMYMDTSCASQFRRILLDTPTF